MRRKWVLLRVLCSSNLLDTLQSFRLTRVFDDHITNESPASIANLPHRRYVLWTYFVYFKVNVLIQQFINFGMKNERFKQYQQSCLFILFISKQKCQVAMHNDGGISNESVESVCCSLMFFLFEVKVCSSSIDSISHVKRMIITAFAAFGTSVLSQNLVH